jgi:hypothetical protein
MRVLIIRLTKTGSAPQKLPSSPIARKQIKAKLSKAKLNKANQLEDAAYRIPF